MEWRPSVHLWYWECGWSVHSKLECTLRQGKGRLPWQSKQSIGLCDFSWYPWCCDSSEQTPGDFPSPVGRALTVWQGTASSPLQTDSGGLSPEWRSTPEPVTVVDSSQGTQVPAIEIPRVDVGCSLWQTHNCRKRHSTREGMSAVSLKPMLTGTQFSWSAILREWRHQRIPLEYRTLMRMAVSIKMKAQDEGPTWALFCIAPVVPAGKLWWVAWCVDRLSDRKPNDVTQKPQTCDVKWSSLGEVRLWTDALNRYWNDGF